MLRLPPLTCRERADSESSFVMIYDNVGCFGISDVRYLYTDARLISDNMEEAVSGVKGELAIKLYGDDLKTLEEKGDQIVSVMRTVSGVEDLGLFRVLGQPNLNFTVDRT